MTAFTTAILEEVGVAGDWRRIDAPNVRLSYATDLETLTRLFNACSNLWSAKA